MMEPVKIHLRSAITYTSITQVVPKKIIINLFSIKYTFESHDNPHFVF